MSNKITTNPLYIDTAATIAFTRPILPKQIDWINPGTVGNSVLIQDIGGNTLFSAVCGQVSTTVRLWPGPQRFILPGKSGNAGGSWQVSTIQSGVLLVWF